MSSLTLSTTMNACEIDESDSVWDCDVDKLSEHETLFWKVCILCEAHMQKRSDSHEQECDR
jgi:hypothetical protein